VALRLVAVRYDADDPVGAATYWAGLLDREVVAQADGALVPGDDRQVGLRFVGSTPDRSGPDWLHLHLTSRTAEDQAEVVERALALGGRPVDVGQRADEGHIVLADPGGNLFCVIEPGNRFLAGCGFLGEVTCEGSREVGRFWGDALGWPLVWDEGEQTAIQSPHGGTKLSWDAPPPDHTHATNRQRFELAAPDVEGEVERLVALGASALGARAEVAELADPDGNAFSIESQGLT